MKLKQQKFCAYYLQTGNATEAAKMAGYSAKTACSQGNRMLRNVEIQQYVAERQRQAKNERMATAEEILEFWAAMMRNKGISAKDRLRASENLGKRYRLLEPESDEVGAKEALNALCNAIREATEHD